MSGGQGREDSWGGERMIDKRENRGWDGGLSDPNLPLRKAGVGRNKIR